MIDRDTKILFNNEVAAGTFLMGIDSSLIAAEALPGQFLMLRVGREMDPLLRRPFSICNVSPDGRVFILYRVVGRGTAAMARMGEGDLLPVLGPLGRGFELPGRGEKCVLVAGGMGIAPMIFLAGTLNTEDLCFAAGFATAANIPDLRQMGFSGVDPLIYTDDGSAGKRGLVTELLPPLLDASDGPPTRVFACGPPAMLRAVWEITGHRRMPCQVSLESAMACGLGACQGCAVAGAERPYLHVCQDGPVFDARALSWEE